MFRSRINVRRPAAAARGSISSNAQGPALLQRRHGEWDGTEHEGEFSSLEHSNAHVRTVGSDDKTIRSLTWHNYIHRLQLQQQRCSLAILRLPRRWKVVILLAILLLLFRSFLLAPFGVQRLFLDWIHAKKLTDQEKFKMKLNAELAAKEAEHAKEHQPSQYRPLKELLLEQLPTKARLQTTLEKELKAIGEFPLVSWGAYHMYRDTFPPELDMPDHMGNLLYHDRELPPTEHLVGNQVLMARRVPNPRQLDYGLPHWELRAKLDNAKNVGIYLIGDELNTGNSFLNDEQDGSRNPFSFLIRDYYFDPLKNAEHTKVLQLGTMTCRRRKLVCSVHPRDVVFVNMLPSRIDRELRPATLPKASERGRNCYWAGSDRFDRKQMVDYFTKTGGCDVTMTPGYDMGLNKTMYAQELMDSVFGLVPRGNNYETHRLAEILMLGGIPAMLDHDAKAAYLRTYVEPIPMVTGRTWREVEQKMLAMSSAALDELQQKVLQWWDRQKECVHADLRWILAQSHAVSEGRDLCASFPTVTERVGWLRRWLRQWR